jgi:hypothetical protein
MSRERRHSDQDAAQAGAASTVFDGVPWWWCRKWIWTWSWKGAPARRHRNVGAGFTTAPDAIAARAMRPAELYPQAGGPEMLTRRLRTAGSPLPVTPGWRRSVLLEYPGRERGDAYESSGALRSGGRRSGHVEARETGDPTPHQRRRPYQAAPPLVGDIFSYRELILRALAHHRFLTV